MGYIMGAEIPGKNPVVTPNEEYPHFWDKVRELTGKFGGSRIEVVGDVKPPVSPDLNKATRAEVYNTSVMSAEVPNNDHSQTFTRIRASINNGWERFHAQREEEAYNKRREKLQTVMGEFNSAVGVSKTVTEIRDKFLRTGWEVYTEKGDDYYYGRYNDASQNTEDEINYVGGFLAGSDVWKKDGNYTPSIYVGLAGDFILDFLRGQELGNPIQAFGVVYVESPSPHPERAGAIRDGTDEHKLLSVTTNTFLGSSLRLPPMVTEGSIEKLQSILLDSKVVETCKQTMDMGLERVFANCFPRPLTSGVLIPKEISELRIPHPQTVGKPVTTAQTTWAEHMKIVGKDFGYVHYVPQSMTARCEGYDELLAFAKKHGGSKQFLQGIALGQDLARLHHSPPVTLSSSPAVRSSYTPQPSDSAIDRLVAEQRATNRILGGMSAPPPYLGPGRYHGLPTDYSFPENVPDSLKRAFGEHFKPGGKGFESDG